MTRPLWLGGRGAVNPPLGVLTNPAMLTALQNYSGGELIANLTFTGGGTLINYTVSGDVNVEIVGTQLKAKAGCTFVGGMNQTLKLGVVTSTGTYTDSAPRALIVPGPPTSITVSPSSPQLEDNAVTGTFDYSGVINNGTAPFSVTDLSSNAKLDISTLVGNSFNVTRSASGTLTPGVSETQSLQVTDASGQILASPQTVSTTILDHTASILITTRTFKDYVGAGGTDIPNRFWMGFKQGDVPSGYYPFIADVSGYPIAKWQFDEVSYHVDGSIAKVIFRHFIPSISAGGTWTAYIYKTLGTYSPATGLRSTSDITAHDFKVKLADVRNAAGTVAGSGNWTCAANNSITVNGKTKILADGPCCTVYKTWGKATDDVGGASQAFITTDWIFEVWTDPSNPANVFAISQSPWVRSGWRAVASPESYTFTAKYYDGASLIQDMSPSATFGPTDVSTVNGDISNLTSTLYWGQAVKFTTTGTLPAGWTAGTAYWGRRTNSTGRFRPVTNQKDCLANDTTGVNNVPIPTDGGSGTHTATVYMSLTYHTGFHCRGYDGRENWTSSKPPIDPAFTQTERRYTANGGWILPFDVTLSATDDAITNQYGSFGYQPGSIGIPDSNVLLTNYYSFIMNPNPGSTGDLPALYGLGKGAIIAWMNMAHSDLQNVRVQGLCGTHAGNMVYIDETLNGSGYEIAAPLTWNNGSNNAGAAYSGYGLPRPNDYYAYWAVKSGITAWTYLGTGAAQNILEFGPVSSSDQSHQFQYAIAAYMLTGDPHMLEQMYFENSRNMISSNGAPGLRHRTVGANNYYGVVGQQAQCRADGYALQALLHCALNAPASDAISQYHKDCLTATLACLAAWFATQSTNFQDGGYWNTPNYSFVQGSGFQMAWLNIAYLQCRRLYGSSDAVSVSDHYANWGKTLVQEMLAGDGYASNNYLFTWMSDANSTSWVAPTDLGLNSSSSATFLSGNIVNDSGVSTAQCVVGDKVFFSNNLHHLPPELTYGAFYYIINLSGNNFQISTTSGGSPITFTATAGGEAAGYLPSVDSSVGFLGSSENYAQMCTAVVFLADIYGLSGFSSPSSVMQGRLADKTWQLGLSDVRFAFSNAGIT